MHGGSLSTLGNVKKSIMQAHIANLQAMSNQQHQENEILQAKLQEQQTNYNLVIGDMFRICEEKQRILEERDEERFEKEFNSMILAQYRDETTEKQNIIEAKDAEIGALVEESTRLKAELYSMQNQRSHYDNCIRKAPSGVKMDGGLVMQGNLDVPTLKKPKKRRRRNGRKGAWAFKYLTARRPGTYLSPVRNMNRLKEPCQQAVAKGHGCAAAPNAIQESVECLTEPTPSLQEMIIFAEREASAYKKELAFCREAIRLGDHLQEDARYMKQLLRVAICSFRKGIRDVEQKRRHNRTREQRIDRETHQSSRPGDPTITKVHESSTAIDANQNDLEAPNTVSSALPLKENIRLKEQEVHHYKKELKFDKEVGRLGDHLLKDVQYVRELSHLAICNFRKGLQEVEQARRPNWSPGLERGSRITCGHHVARQTDSLSPTRAIDRPPPPRPIEQAIAKANGFSIAIGAIRENLESSKLESALSLKEMVAVKKQEAGAYQNELIFCKEAIQLGDRLLQGIQRVEELLQRAINNFDGGKGDMGQERHQT
ncbi:hypothetical protein DL762_009596 [Monosporascus cannonballus]|uniref:Uncharacterized protein n=1 Tax=Monosporascus cannonballus TaxID=155416 RepID=A0ABY0GT93_9PEZI|nr:hypothetical protein DL762_009596 [Monosporascus cannonballus]